MNEERKVQKVKISLMREKTFAMWQGIMMVGKTSVVDNFPSACTNGRDEMYGRKFVAALSEKELAFVILHENLHKAFRHLTTWQRLAKENMRLANQAMDYVINLMLVDMDPNEKWLVFPKNPDGSLMGLLDRRFKGMHTKQVYDILKQEKKEKGNDGDGEGEPGDGGQPGDGDGFDEHDWAGAKSLSEEDKQVLEREIDQALRQGEMQHKKLNGDGAGTINREIGELLRPQIDWKEALREFVKTTCAAKDQSTWRRPNRRMIGEGIYMPSLIGEKVGHGVIGCDTSGSICEELRKFLSEMKVIAEDLRPEKLHVLYWDGHVAGHEIYGDGELPLDSLATSTQPKGGGGTTPSCVPKYLKANAIKPEFIIMFTDGVVGNDWGGDWGGVPVLWVICNAYGGENITAPNGKTIHINS
jgi:prepilin-type processing-associated H-X9-DG protein